jgi:hypothetical protein
LVRADVVDQADRRGAVGACVGTRVSLRDGSALASAAARAGYMSMNV